MSSLTPAEQRERLSKAMGQAFLAHQVDSLERSVDKMAFSRDARLYNDSSSRTKDTEAQRVRETRIIHVSALVHALPLLKRWLKEDTYRMVVPLEALSALDELKRAPQPLHDLASEATKFLEAQFNIAHQLSSSTLPSSSLSGKGDMDPRIRLRAQAAREECPWSQVEKRFTVPEGFVPLKTSVEKLLDEDGNELEPRPPTPADIPRPLRSTLQCFLYFLSSSSSASLVVYNLPSSPSPPSSAPAGVVDYLPRSTGDLITHYSTTFLNLPVHVVGKEAVTAAKEWARAQAQARERERERGRGRGGARNGRGRGGGQRTEEGGGRGRGKTLFVP